MLLQAYNDSFIDPRQWHRLHHLSQSFRASSLIASRFSAIPSHSLCTQGQSLEEPCTSPTLTTQPIFHNISTVKTKTLSLNRVQTIMQYNFTYDILQCLTKKSSEGCSKPASQANTALASRHASQAPHAFSQPPFDLGSSLFLKSTMQLQPSL